MATDQPRHARGEGKGGSHRADDGAGGSSWAAGASSGRTRRPRTTSELQASLEARQHARQASTAGHERRGAHGAHGAAPRNLSMEQQAERLAERRQAYNQQRDKQRERQRGAQPQGEQRGGAHRAAGPQGERWGAERPSEQPAEQRPGQKKGRIALFVGIAFLVIAVIIAGTLVYRYVSAGAQAKTTQQAAGLDINDVGLIQQDSDLDEIQINWDALRAINPDVVGWVIIPDTRIKYPIVQCEDNDYYLNHLFDRTPNDSGTIFLDYLNDPAIKGNNNFIYGHNLLDGSMFASLKAWREQEFFDAHRTIILATPAMNYRLEVVACLVCDGDDKIRRFEFSGREDFEEYVEMLLGYAVLSELAPGEIPENIYCFVTCTDTNYAKRTILLARISEEKAPKGAKTT